MDDPTEAAALWRDGHTAGWDAAVDAAITTARQAGASREVMAALNRLAEQQPPEPPAHPAPDILTAAAAALEAAAERVAAAGCPPELWDALAALLRIAAAGGSPAELRAAITRTAAAVPARRPG